MSSTPPANISSKCPPSRHGSAVPAHPSPDPIRPPRSPPLEAPTSPTKRPRPSRPNMAAEHASPSSDSSQSGGADNETEHDRSAPQAAVPPKKKRTRTLTTPHQSAVLHALLAKSRFPTTAMREEVGRQIGLSARKVQIWFQNQRQKARRPQSDSAPLSRPPQFGPFPIITSAGPSSSPYLSPSTSCPEASHSASSSAKSTHDSVASLDSNPTLSGPGIPNWSSPSYLAAEERDPSRRPPMSPAARSGNSQHPQLSQGISARDSRGNARGFAPPPAQSTHPEVSPHFSAVLPPINPLEARSSTESYVSATSSVPPQPPSRTFVNIFHRPNTSAQPTAEQGNPVRLDIPPPFVLQPQPQWDPQTFVPYTRPAFSSWLQPSASARTTLSSMAGHDRVTHTPSSDVSRHRHFYSSPGEPHLHSRHIIQPPPSRTRQFSISVTSSHASVSGERHARSDNEAEED